MIEVGTAPPADRGTVEYARAVLNILDDFGEERALLQQTQRAVLNVLEDANSEKEHLEDTQRAVLNILDDLALEKDRLEATQEEVARSAQALRISLKEKELLLKEVHHRVKNNLQVISSLLNLQARYLPDTETREVFMESQNRVLSIALVHEKLYQSANLSHINFGEYLLSLLAGLLEAYSAHARGIRSVIDVSSVAIPIDLAVPCGLIVNELVINSLKHAFPERRSGTIRVTLLEGPHGALQLEVADDGIGMPVDLDPRGTVTLGLDLVFTFAEQIEAAVDVRRDGGTAFCFNFSKVAS